MEQRLTLISDPTDEFANNTNNSFRVRIPNGLRLEGKGWHVALLSLTLPNSKKTDGLLNMNAGKKLIVSGYTLLNFHTKSGDDYTRTNMYAQTSIVVEDGHLRQPATTGVGYWTHLINIFEERIQTNVETKRAQLVAAGGTPYLLLKRDMRAAFHWDGDVLVLESAGGNTGFVTGSSTTIYSFFDLSLEVALQWGFVVPAPSTGYVNGPNCSYIMDNASITDSHPPRTSTVTSGLNLVLSQVNGKAYHPHTRPDYPSSAAPGQSKFNLFWTYVDAGDVYVRFSRTVEWHFHGLNKTFEDIHNHASKAVLVYTNLQQSTIVGGTKAQLLRELVVKRGTEHGEHTYTEPLHLQWVPVSTHNVDIVEVQLADVNGELSTFPKGKSLVTLALKQMV